MPEDNKVPNRQILEYIFKNNQINIFKGDLIKTLGNPLSSKFDFDRVEGMMLGLAIGDALGNTSEGMLPPNEGSSMERFGIIFQADT
jgi:hypothetical protein